MRARTVVLAMASLLMIVAIGILVAPHVGEPRAEPSSDAAPGPQGSAPPPATPEELYAAISGGVADGVSFGDPVALSVAAAPDVVLPSGRLVASDAMIVDARPFTTEFQPGRHPVTLLEAAFESGDRRVAAAMVRVGAGEPSRWELALVDGQDPAALGPDEFFGYGVDSGTGSFMSPEAVEVLADEARYEAYSDAVFDGMFPAPDVYERVVAVDVDPASGANVVAIASGFGDGSYPTWVGFDADGRPVAFLTDFGILDAGA